MNDKRVYEIPTSVMEKADGSSVTVKDAKARRMLDRKPEINDTAPSATSVYSSQKVEQKLAAAVADFVSFSEDQTSRTDAEKAQARNNIGASGDWTLLWANAYTTSDFAAQTIQLDLSKYQEVRTVFKHWKGGSTLTIGSIDVFVEQSGAFNSVSNATGSGTHSNVQRVVSVTSAGVAFANCTQKTFSSSSAATVSNANNIPVYIYAR